MINRYIPALIGLFVGICAILYIMVLRQELINTKLKLNNVETAYKQSQQNEVYYQKQMVTDKQITDNYVAILNDERSKNESLQKDIYSRKAEYNRAINITIPQLMRIIQSADTSTMPKISSTTGGIRQADRESEPIAGYRTAAGIGVFNNQCMVVTAMYNQLLAAWYQAMENYNAAIAIR